jgi:hypothetical protein
MKEMRGKGRREGKEETKVAREEEGTGIPT